MTEGFGLVPGLLWSAFQDLDIIKSDLGLGRLVHFLALAYMVTQLGLARVLQGTAFGLEMQRLGRYGLPVFAAGSILSAAGEVIMTLAAVKTSASPHIVGMVFTLVGIIGLLALARYLEWKKTGSAAPRPGRAEPLGQFGMPSGRLPR
jgi:hypothetical protein